MALTPLGIMSQVEYVNALAMLATSEGMTPKELASMLDHRITPPNPDPNPSGTCTCGCGESVSAYTYNNAGLGRYKGNHPLFAHGHNATKHIGPRYIPEDRGYSTPCWIWQRAINKKGYAIAAKSLAHRQMYEEHVGPIPNDLQVDHLCRQRECVNPGHLELVTLAENVRRGNVAKLTPNQVTEIIGLLRGGDITQAEIARSYGVTQNAIYSIRKNITWRNIPREGSNE